MMQLSPPWEFSMLCHWCPTPHAFYNHSHHLFIMSWTWGGLKADVTHDDLTSMGKWTRWLIVSKTNTLIIRRRAQCNRSLTTNLYLSWANGWANDAAALHFDKLIREPYFISFDTLAQACPQDLVSMMMLKLWTWETVNAHGENPLPEYSVKPGFKVLDCLA